MFVNSDLTDLLSLFNARDVRYLVVGGYAVVQHAEPRFTNDLDLCIGVAIPGLIRDAKTRARFFTYKFNSLRR